MLDMLVIASMFNTGRKLKSKRTEIKFEMLKTKLEIPNMSMKPKCLPESLLELLTSRGCCCKSCCYRVLLPKLLRVSLCLPELLLRPRQRLLLSKVLPELLPVMTKCLRRPKVSEMFKKFCVSCVMFWSSLLLLLLMSGLS